MDYEKKYKEIVGKIRKAYLYAQTDSTKAVLEEIFPETKESEEEKVRRFIVKWVNERMPVKPYDNDGFDKETVLAWLEKQGEKGTNGNDREIPNSEQKPVNKVKPKFKDGDWIIDIQGVAPSKIIGYEDDSYLIKTSCSQFYLPMKLTEKNYRLWTIQDAKDGNVLDANGAPFIYKKHNKDYVYFYCGVNLAGEFIEANGIGVWNSNNKVYPATKEQRDLLFQKMHEKGYEWDAEHKQLKKIEQKPINKIEPKFKVGDKIQYLKGCGTIMTIEKIENGEYIFGNNLGHTTIESGNKWHLVNLIEQTPSWGEEDKYNHNIILCLLNNECVGREDKRIAIEWFKSLRPHNTWKPSDEQMAVLNEVVNYAATQANMHWNDYLYNVLKSLREQLKKL